MATEAVTASGSGDNGIPADLAKPLHVQRAERALRLEPLLSYIGGLLHQQQPPSDGDTTDSEVNLQKETDTAGNKYINGMPITKAERKADKNRLYNFSKVKKSRKWLKNILISDSSSDEEDEEAGTLSTEKLQLMLKLHKYHRQCREQFYRNPELQQYQYYSVGLLSNHDKFPDHQKSIIGTKKIKEKRKLEKKIKAAKGKIKKEPIDGGYGMCDISGADGSQNGFPVASPSLGGPSKGKIKKPTPEQLAARRRKLFIMISKKEVPKAQKQKASARKEMLAQLKKVSKECTKECRRAAIQSQKVQRETPMRAKRLSREMLLYWKRFEKVEKEHRKRAEKEALEQRKIDLEFREARRQQRKLNFLITQTELYAHFMSRKMSGDNEEGSADSILCRLEGEGTGSRRDMDSVSIVDDGYDGEEMKALALRNVETAYQTHQARTRMYDISSDHITTSASDLSFANPTISTEADRPQPIMFQGKLKGYQLKGMNWLANLYYQGINGILADEMGLGKTVQSISFLAHLAESQGIWGPFLVVAPASTLHNWQQECAKFIPKMKVVPYWGNTQDRRILRTFWNQEHLHTQEASFHVVITSYQLVIQDVKYFQRIKWQYMILDEAQALKSTSSVRWKILLGFNCRNRLLLTGTPIQNSMAELWALLHFIMPTLFDSHEEFNEWFSKDIESHAERQSGIDENQLSRLHMILKPFMLRRVKKDVENELSDKIEILVYCPLTTRQRYLYQAVKNKISIEDLLQSATGSTSQAQSSTSSLMNLVMQFRKVCNHPELFERREIRGPFYMRLDPYYIPKLVYREGVLDKAVPSQQHLLCNKLSVFNPVNIHRSLFHSSHGGSCFSFSRFINMSPAELHQTMQAGLLVRWLSVFLWLKEAYRIHHQTTWHSSEPGLSSREFLLRPLRTTSPPNLSSSCNLRKLVFLHSNTSFSTYQHHVYHFMPETASHRKIRLRKLSGKRPGKGPLSPTSSGSSKLPLSPTKSKQVAEHDTLPVHRHILRPSRVLHLQSTDFPSFIYYATPKVLVTPLDHYTSDRSAAWDHMRALLCGTRKARDAFFCGTPEQAIQVRYSRWCFHPSPPGGFMGLTPKHGYSGIFVPDKETLVTDAGKLYVLDTLLARLKAEGHRVLIYSQMTRMIDLLEEYMWHRKHTYMRLDGSSKISDRRDMVADFQTRSDIFVFLLSTRAGGLGINLTAADTVIFYDSDWNPTVDQQAMDRAHRLGQTKQVTVYRLICKGTIEERILQRAKEKSEIQRMVISGGNFRPDILKPKEVVSLLLDDDEMERKLFQKQEEKKTKEDTKEDRKRRKEQLPRPPGKRGPGRPPKKKKIEENVTIPAPDPELSSLSILDSASATASPQSVKSACSETTYTSLNLSTQDESSNDGLVIVDDLQPLTPVSSTPTPPPPVKRGRGRPRGSGVGRRPRGRGTAQKVLSAAELAGAQAAMTAYATYGYNYAGANGKGNNSSSRPT